MTGIQMPNAENNFEYPSTQERETDYNERMESIRYKTGTSSERDIDPEDAGEDYGLIKGERLPQTLSTDAELLTVDPRHTAMRALIATVVATGCSCSRCERLRQFVPNIGRRTLKQESANYDTLTENIRYRTRLNYDPSKENPSKRYNKRYLAWVQRKEYEARAKSKLPPSD